MMMKLITSIAVLLLPIVAAQDCFCPGGAPAPYPDQLIKLSSSTQTTCGSLEKEASKTYLVRTYGCNYYRYYGHLCGCDEPEEPIQKCNLCQDGQDIPVNVQRSAGLSECELYSIEAKYDPFRQGCGYYNFLGSLCGCTKNRPPFDGCTICGDGSEPPLASTKQVSVAGVEGGTCENVAHFTRYVKQPDTSECIGSQATLGTFCGCDKQNQPKSNCPLCLGRKGTAVSNDPAPKFSYLNTNGQTKIYQSGLSCLEAEMLAHKMSQSNNEIGKDICSAIQTQLADACCGAPDPAATTGQESTPSAASAYGSSSCGAAAILLGAAIHGLCQIFL